jgi:hypothetical protein
MFSSNTYDLKCFNAVNFLQPFHKTIEKSNEKVLSDGAYPEA